MKTIFTAAILALGLCFATTSITPAEARPNTSQETSIKKKQNKKVVKKKTTKKKYVRKAKRAKVAVAPPPPPPAKCQFLFWEVDCAPEAKQKQEIQQAVHDAGKPSIGSLTAPKHIKKAETMIGMTARKDRAKLKQYFADKIDEPIDPLRIAWCAAWANAVLADAGYATTDSLLARSFLAYGQVIREPKQGDIVVLTRGRKRWAGHVGFFVERVVIDGKAYIAVLGGNQKKAITIAYYPESRVLGYRAPVAA